MKGEEVFTGNKKNQSTTVLFILDAMPCQPCNLTFLFLFFASFISPSHNLLPLGSLYPSQAFRPLIPFLALIGKHKKALNENKDAGSQPVSYPGENKSCWSGDRDETRRWDKQLLLNSLSA